MNSVEFLQKVHNGEIENGCFLEIHYISIMSDIFGSDEANDLIYVFFHNNTFKTKPNVPTLFDYRVLFNPKTIINIVTDKALLTELVTDFTNK